MTKYTKDITILKVANKKVPKVAQRIYM